jgi:DNA polymerase-3 subunit delta'
VYQWLKDDYKYIIQAWQQRQAQSWLISGADNSGQEQLICQFIAYILCHKRQGLNPCEKCNSCQLLHEHNHPDLLQLDLEEEQTNLKMEQINQAIEFANISSHLANNKIIYLPKSNALNINTANALLKILEEPPQNCYFILASNNIKRLLPTILSRCFKVQLHLPSWNEALAIAQIHQPQQTEFWLRFFAGEPLFNPPLSMEEIEQLINTLTKPSIDNIFKLSTNLDPKRVGMEILLDCLIKWLHDVLLISQQQPALYFNQANQAILELTKRLNIYKLFGLIDEIIELSPWASHPLNHKLQFENLLLKYQQIYV